MAETDPTVWTIPAHRAFADALAEGLIARHRASPLALARGLLLLPNNRAVAAMRDAFVRLAGNGLLLPRLIAVGDDLFDDALPALLDMPDAANPPLPPAIAPLERWLIIARLVEQERARAGQPVDAVHALRLARDLVRVRDQMLFEELDAAALGRLERVDELSRHWQSALSLLQTVLQRWEAELAGRGLIERAARRNRQLRTTARGWRTAPPTGFVVAAGITVSAPAMAALLATITRLPDGEVVLPALDLGIDEDEWQALGPFDPDPVTGAVVRGEETHPQYHLKLLLDRMSIARVEVRQWPRSGGASGPSLRGRAVSQLFAPARFTAQWRDVPETERRFGSIRALSFATPASEAQTIALLLRETVETPGARAALVTPDRVLAKRVSAHLERWGITADDSAGTPLAETPAGTLLIAMARLMADRAAPVALLSLLKHPLVAGSEERLAWLDRVRVLDRALRGPRPGPGLAGIARHLEGGDDHDRAIRAAALAVWPPIATVLGPLDDCPDEAALGVWLQRLREAMALLAGDRGWAGVDGRATATLVEALEQHSDAGPARVRRDALPALLTEAMADVAVRQAYQGHPRVAIWGQLEARLQKADRMVLAGLNEGSWPAVPTPDPWLAPRIRHELGLPGLERRIGLAAHDLAQALGAPEVILTRADRDAEGQPAVPSRFWLRIAALTGEQGPMAAHRIARDPVHRWLGAIDDGGEPSPTCQPAPRPPLADRPSSINVTQVDRLKADPFAYYAQAMLGLRPLDPVDADPGPAWQGSAVHRVLEQWQKEDDCDPAKLGPRAIAMLAAMDAHPMVRALWQPRLLAAMEFFAARVARERDEGRHPIAAEACGSTVIAGITVNGRADRIDRIGERGLGIVDYKTGEPPSTRAVRYGFAQQLGLLGLIAASGGFAGVSGEPVAFEYWSLTKKNDAFGLIKTPVGNGGKSNPIPLAEFLALAEANFAEVARRWLTGDEAFTAKLHPEYAPYRDYDQLMRLEEWFGRGGGGAA